MGRRQTLEQVGQVGLGAQGRPPSVVADLGAERVKELVCWGGGSGVVLGCCLQFGLPGVAFERAIAKVVENPAALDDPPQAWQLDGIEHVAPLA
eukprot:12799198-Alexandrium_andersonii.AAC.1